MPHIVGENISPWSRYDSKWLTIKEDGTVEGPPKYMWRGPLGDLLEKVTREFWELPEEAVTCFFGVDPSVPVNPYPVATLHVHMHFEGRSEARRKTFARRLIEETEAFLNKLRAKEKVGPAKTQVIIRPTDRECTFDHSNLKVS